MTDADTVRFGTSGVRGKAGELVAGKAFSFAMAFCRHLSGASPRTRELFIGYDRRLSSPAIRDICASAAVQAGFRPVDCGQLPTPALAAFAMANGAGAIMVTGSHIPADRNGIKFYLPSGEIGKADELAISSLANRAMLQAGDMAAAKDLADRHLEANEFFLSRYAAAAASLDLAGRRIGVWAHSSVGADLLAAILERTGSEIILHGKSIRFVAVDTEAIPNDVAAELRSMAAAERFDAIVSTDADADRPLITDETGIVLAGDLVAFAAAMQLGATAIATPVTSNSAIEQRFGGTVVRTRIGSPFVIAAMDDLVRAGEKTVAGFEANGGLMTASAVKLNGCPISALPTRDSVLPILGVFAHLANGQNRLGELANLNGFLPAKNGRLTEYPAETARRLTGELAGSESFRRKFLQTASPVTIADIADGIALKLPEGARARIRASGNAPELRVYIEARAESAADRLLEVCLASASNFLESAGGGNG